MNSCLTKTLFLQSPSSETNKKIEKCYKAKIVGYVNIFLWGKRFTRLVLDLCLLRAFKDFRSPKKGPKSFEPR